MLKAFLYAGYTLSSDLQNLIRIGIRLFFKPSEPLFENSEARLIDVIVPYAPYFFLSDQFGRLQNADMTSRRRPSVGETAGNLPGGHRSATEMNR